jgi:hypothetical protein
VHFRRRRPSFCLNPRPSEQSNQLGRLPPAPRPVAVAVGWLATWDAAWSTPPRAVPFRPFLLAWPLFRTMYPGKYASIETRPPPWDDERRWGPCEVCGTYSRVHPPILAWHPRGTYSLGLLRFVRPPRRSAHEHDVLILFQ